MTAEDGKSTVVRGRRRLPGWLKLLSGLALLEGLFHARPLLKRELVAMLRTRRAYWLLLTVVGVSGMLTVISWPEPGLAQDGQRTVMTFGTFAFSMLAGILIFVPAFSSGAISGERESGTYELLYTTLLPPSSIIFAKIGSSTGFIFLILFATLPIAFLFHLVGGLSFWMLARVYWIIFLSVLAGGFICLTQSMRCRTTSQAVVSSLACLLFWFVGWSFLIMLGGFFLDQLDDHLGWNLFPAGGPGAGFMNLVWGPSPFYALIMTFNPGGVLPMGDPLLFFTIFWLVVILLHYAYLRWRVRKPDLPVASGRGFAGLRRRRDPDAPRPVKRTWFTRLLLRLGESGLPLLSNPVFRKEVRSEFFGRLWYRRLMFWLLFLIFGAICYTFDNDHEPGVAVPGMLGLLFLVIFVPGSMASSLPREHERGNFDFLRSTRLSLGQVLDGKALASGYAVSGIFFAVALPALILGPFLYDPGEFLAILRGLPVALGILLVTLAFLVGVSSLASVLFRRSLGAILVTFGVLVALYIFFPILLGLLSALSRSSGDGLEFLLAASNPFFTFGAVMERVLDRGEWNDRHGKALGMLITFCVVHGGLALGLYIGAREAAKTRLARD